MDFDGTPGALSDLLTASGTEVEGESRFGSAAQGVIVAKVNSVKPHPDADSLRIAELYDGTTTHMVVCGAPNLVEGMFGLFAPEGSLLPAVSSKPLKAATIRGVRSPGMLLSAAELGMGDDHTGIIVLDDSLPPGTPLERLAPPEDTVLELEITPNRPDCMSIIGIAREVAAATGSALKMPEPPVLEEASPVSELVRITVEDPEGCPRYSAKAVKRVKIGPSPFWLQRRLRASGMRPVNNVVDVTNYVLLELGQPLHAFDLDDLGGSEIRVRRATPSERIVTLDGNERELSQEMLVIADATKPIAVAGVMGGENSEVRDTSRDILVESAYFDPVSVYLTSRRLGLRSDASSRFERGTDRAATITAAERSVELISSVAGGVVCAGVVDCGGTGDAPDPIILRPARLNMLLGLTVPDEFIVEVLRRLECEVSVSKEGFTVVPPTFRRDLVREIDLVEEVARLYGFDRIPSGLPPASGFSVGLNDRQLLEARLVDSLVAQGLSEVLTYSFMNSADVGALGMEETDLARVVKVINPVAETGDVMRTTVLPGLLRTAVRNINRGNRQVSVFEVGRVFFEDGAAELPEERDTVGILLSGPLSGLHWQGGGEPVDYFSLKGIVEGMADRLNLELGFQRCDLPFLVPGRGASIHVNDRDVGYLGQLHPRFAERFDLEQEAYVAEFFIDELLANSALMRRFSPYGRYPSVKVDLAVVVDDSVTSAELRSTILKAGGRMLKGLTLFDLYKGEQIPEGKKSLAYALEFGSDTETLNDEAAHARFNRIVRVLTNDHGAYIRGYDPEPED